MPRIAAVFAVFAIAAFSIGFNIFRYPAVWEKIASGGNLSQADDADQPETSDESEDYSHDSDSGNWYDDDSADDGRVAASIAGSAEDSDSSDPWDYNSTSSWDNDSEDSGDAWDNDYDGSSNDYDYDSDDSESRSEYESDDSEDSWGYNSNKSHGNKPNAGRYGSEDYESENSRDYGTDDYQSDSTEPDEYGNDPWGYESTNSGNGQNKSQGKNNYDWPKPNRSHEEQTDKTDRGSGAAKATGPNNGKAGQDSKPGANNRSARGASANSKNSNNKKKPKPGGGTLANDERTSKPQEDNQKKPNDSWSDDVYNRSDTASKYKGTTSSDPWEYDTSNTGDDDNELVPVARSDRSTRAGDESVRRLPDVSQWQPNARGGRTSLGGRSIASYPGTGAE